MPNRGAVRLLVLLLTAGVLSVAGPAVADSSVPRPVLNVDFPDPAVVATPGGLVAYSTGDRVPHAWTRSADGPWRRGAGVLTHRPSWSRDGGVWAVDVARVGGRWLLYYATPVKGMGEHGRCIGVARSSSARGPFRPVGKAPLVCPSYAGTPTAQDPLLPRDPTLPRAGVIDPSWFRDADGSSYLLYKTDRIPSTIRIVPLAPNGQSVATDAVSVELLRSAAGVIENPVLTQRPEGYVMLASEGDWTRCGYRTPLAALDHPPRLDPRRDRDAARRRDDRAVRSRRGRPRGGRRPDARVPARLDVPRHDVAVRRLGQVGPQAAPAGTSGDVRRQAGLGRRCAPGHRLAPGPLSRTRP